MSKPTIEQCLALGTELFGEPVPPDLPPEFGGQLLTFVNAVLARWGNLAQETEPHASPADGFVLVPKEPTPEMLAAGEMESDNELATYYSVFKAMLAVAPAAEPEAFEHESPSGEVTYWGTKVTARVMGGDGKISPLYAAPQPDRAADTTLFEVPEHVRQYIAAFEAEVERLRKDAERYRWLREQPNDTSAPRIDVVYWTAEDEATNAGEGLRLEELDAAIAAALAEHEAKKGGE